MEDIMLLTIALLIIGFIVGLVAGALLTVLIVKGRFGGQINEKEILLSERIHEINNLTNQLQEALSKYDQSNTTLHERDIQIKGLEVQIAEERKRSVEKLATVQEAEEKLANTFKSLSGDILKSNSEEFLKKAEQTMKIVQTEAKGDLDQRKQAVESMVKPLSDNLQKVEKYITDLEAKREGAYKGINQYLETLMESQKELRTATTSLDQAMRNTSSRGKWGELALERVVEYAGMKDHVDFDTQKNISSSERPDMVVHLPGGKHIIIDSKAPMEAYLRAMEVEKDVERENLLLTHAESVKKHIAGLSAKKYWNSLDSTPEFVIMFLPAESIFSAALEVNPELIAFGAEKKVIPATPTTLIALLKAVAYGWQQEDVWKNAQKIGELGKDLYERIAVVAGYFQAVGKGLNSATTSYNKAVSSLETRLMPTARKFKELGIGSSKEIKEQEKIETIAKQLSSEEVTETEPDAMETKNQQKLL
jgi:DNA recombination protein RmuC